MLQRFQIDKQYTGMPVPCDISWGVDTKIIRPDPIFVARGERTLLVMMHVRNMNSRSALSDAPEVK